MQRRPKKPKRGVKLQRKQKANIKALAELGHSKCEIEKLTGHSHHTIAKYLDESEAYADPRMQAMVTKIKEKEILDLTVLNVRAKARLHELAPRANMIESIALMDRTFQQLRLLEGKSTQNIATLTQFVQEAHKAHTTNIQVNINAGDNKKSEGRFSSADAQSSSRKAHNEDESDEAEEVT
jgi:hypothetical protein